MHKTLLATFIGASVFAVPAFAQVVPATAGQAAAHGSTQAGASTPGMNANASATIGAGTTATTGAAGAQPLGLGGLLKQAQARDPGASAHAASDGAGPTGSLGAKARAKAHARGH